MGLPSLGSIWNTISSWLTGHVSLNPNLLSNQTYTFQVAQGNVTLVANFSGYVHPPGYTHAVDSLGFGILFPTVLILLLLYYGMARLIGSRDMIESAKSYLSDFGMVVALAGIVSAFGFEFFYNILNLGWFYTRCYEMYNGILYDLFGLYASETFLATLLKFVSETIKAWGDLKIKVSVKVASVSGSLPFIKGATQGVGLVLDTVIKNIQSLQKFTAEGFVVCSLIIMLLMYSQIVSIPFLIPLGTLFRAVPVTRSVGSVLLALGIGFGFVFPIVTYTLTYSGLYFINNMPVSTPAGPMTIAQAKHYTMTISPSDFLNPGCLTIFSCPAIQKLQAFLYLQTVEVVALLFFIHLIPLMCLAVTVMGIIGMSIYFGGERLKIRVPFRLW